MSEDIAQRIRSAVERSRAAWSNRNHDEDAAILSSFELRERVRSRFSMSLSLLVTFHAFWSPSAQRMFARSITRSPSEAHKPARGSPALPPDAIYVNTYTDQAKPSDFVKDLIDVLICLEHPAAA